MEQFRYFADLALEVEPPDAGILSRTIHNDEHIKVVVFGFGENEELSEHTASTPAILHVLRGNAAITLGNEQFEGKGGTWAHMAAGLPHSIRAISPVTLLLILVKGAASTS